MFETNQMDEIQESNLTLEEKLEAVEEAEYDKVWEIDNDGSEVLRRR